MKRMVIALLVVLALFIGLIYALLQVNWLSLLGLERLSANTEQTLGEALWKVQSKTFTLLDSTHYYSAADTILQRIAAANGIDRSTIQLHIVENAEPNAFAMPAGHMVVHTGLMHATTSPEQLAGVMAHELAHIRLGHVMKQLMRTVGLSLIIRMAAGEAADMIESTAGTLTTMAFSREMEAEADATGVKYLLETGVDPEAFAQFMEYIQENQTTQVPEWMSTHPDSGSRAEEIRKLAAAQSANKAPAQLLLSDATWLKVSGLR
jgi:beta-barrel assembly-enhancing protease